MNLKDLQDLINKESRKKDRVKTAQKVAVGMGIVAAAGVAAGILFALKSGKETRKDLKGKAADTVKIIKDTIKKTAESMHESTTHAAQELCDVVVDVHGKTDDVKKDLKDGYHEITQDVQKTAENISDDI